jgi:hypothetical protein
VVGPALRWLLVLRARIATLQSLATRNSMNTLCILSMWWDLMQGDRDSVRLGSAIQNWTKGRISDELLKYYMIITYIYHGSILYSTMMPRYACLSKDIQILKSGFYVALS